jgi:integrase
MKPRTLSDYKRLLKHFPFGRQSIADVTARDILQKLAKLPPSEKHHAFTAARRFFRYAVQQHLIDRSPMESMAPPPAGGSRERVLTADELRAVYRTARAGTTYFHRITALLALTGQRKNEIAHLEWDWIEDGLVTLPSWLTKNKRSHTFPIGSEAQAILTELPRFEGVPFVFPAERQRSERTTVFNGWGKPKQRFDKECGISGWQLRDLRRTMSTYMAELHVPQLHVEKLLNHVSGGTQSPIAQVYNRYSYLEEMREAVLKWEAYLGTLLVAR